MALNLWKLGGQPTSYNPLPILGGSSWVVIGLKDYTFRFKAKSLSGTSKLRVVDNGAAYDILQDITIPSTFTEYEYTFTSTAEAQRLQIFEYPTTNNDIQVIDIELVQKPLPKLTINGIDGFKSGKWSLHANSVAVDDETLLLNASAANERSSLILNVIPNATYTLAHSNSSGGYMMLRDTNASGTIISNTTSSPVTFTAPASGILCVMTHNAISGLVTYKRPMLNLGTIPAPYSKKTGDKMVMPVAKGNLFPENTVEVGGFVSNTGVFNNSLGTYTSYTSSQQFIPINPNLDYWFNISNMTANGNPIQVYYYDSSKSFISREYGYVSGGRLGTLGTGSKPVNASFVRLMYPLDSKGVQFTQSSTLQPYKPYAVQTNRLPLRYVPKKNLFDGQWELGTYQWVGGVKIPQPGESRCVNLIPVKPNTTYVFKTEGYTGGYTIHRFNYAKQSLGGYTCDATNTFTTPSDCYFIGFRIVDTSLQMKTQLEEGSTATPYEPYQLVLPRYRTGLYLNGTSDHVMGPDFGHIGLNDFSIEVKAQLHTFFQGMRFMDKLGGNFAVATDAVGHIQIWAGAWWTFNYIVPLNIDFTFKIERVNQTTLNLYVNGVFQQALTVTSHNMNAVGQLYIGSNGTLISFRGFMKSVKITSSSANLEYDFTNPSNIVGTTVLQNAENLIPSFEDARWSLHANTQVLGKDVLRLNATAGTQDNYFLLTNVPNGSYLFTLSGACSYRIYNHATDTSSPLGAYNGITGYISQVINSTTGTIRVRVGNILSSAGNYDIIKPSLYQLDSKEGTLVGNPVKMNKTSKRTLYSKR